MDTTEGARVEVQLIEESLAPDEEKFLLACGWMRRNHVIAFILGLFSFGIPYAMAGIGGAALDDETPPLTFYWARNKVKWIATITLLGELFFLGSWFVAAVALVPAMLFALPVVAILAFAIMEILYEVFKNSDGFLVIQAHAFRSEASLARIEGPANVVSKAISKLPFGARPCVALMWAWVLGSVYVSTFFAGVALVIMIGWCLLTLLVVLFVVGLFSDQKDGGSDRYVPRRLGPLPRVPPIPLEDHGILDEDGQLAVHRSRGLWHKRGRKVGFHRGGFLYLYRQGSGEAVEVYEIFGNEIRDLLNGRLYGTFDEQGVYDADGSLMYRLSPVNS